MLRAASGKVAAIAALAPLPATLAEAGWSIKPSAGALPPGVTVQARGISTRAQSHSRSRSDSTGSDSTASGEVSEEVGEAVSAQVSAMLLVLMRQRTHYLAHAHSTGHPPTRRDALSSPKGKQHAQCAGSGGDRPGAAGGGMVPCTMVGCTDGAAEGAGGGGGGEAPGPMQAAMQAFGEATPVYYPEAMDAPMEEVSTEGGAPSYHVTPYYLTTLLLYYYWLLTTCFLLLTTCGIATGEHRGDGARAAAQGTP